MSEVLLFNPNIMFITRDQDQYSVMEHLGLGLLASSLEQEGYEVEILDAYAKNLSQDSVVEKIIEINPKFIGVTTVYISWEEATDILKRVADYNKDIFIFAGGEHCTYSAESILEDFPFIKAVVRGEGELTVADLIQNHDNLADVKGIYYRDNETNQIIRNMDREAIADLDNIPFAN